MALVMPDGTLFGLLTPEQAAAYLGVSRRQLQRLEAQEGVPSVAVGKRKRYRREDLDAWVARPRSQLSTSHQGGTSTVAGSRSTGPDKLSPQVLETYARLSAKLNGSTPKPPSASGNLVAFHPRRSRKPRSP